MELDWAGNTNVSSSHANDGESDDGIPRQLNEWLRHASPKNRHRPNLTCIARHLLASRFLSRPPSSSKSMTVSILGDARCPLCENACCSPAALRPSARKALFDRRLRTRRRAPEPEFRPGMPAGPSVNWKFSGVADCECWGEAKSSSDGGRATAGEGGGYASKSIAAWRLLAPRTDGCESDEADEGGLAKLVFVAELVCNG